MTIAFSAASRKDTAPFALAPGAARLFLSMTIILGAACGLWATDPGTASQAVSAAGADLTRLLRAMALLKVVLAAGAAAAIWWRLGSPIRLPWMMAYAGAAGAMAAGPGLIWTMAHVGLGALLLHGGLFSTILLLWRDPAVETRLAALVAARRNVLRSRR